MIFSSLILSLSLTVTSCGNDDPAAPENGNGNKNEGGIQILLQTYPRTKQFILPARRFALHRLWRLTDIK